jgi:hypothetical protein
VLAGVLSNPGDRRLVALFGARGLSSLLFALLPVFAGIGGAQRLFAITALVVLLSVLVHGGGIALFLRAHSRREGRRARRAAPILERADAAAEAIRSGLAAEFAAYEIEAAVTGFRSVLQVHFGAVSVSSRRELLRSDLTATRTFLLGMVAAGILWPPIHPAVTSGAHKETDADAVVAAAHLVLERMRRS